MESLLEGQGILAQMQNHQTYTEITKESLKKVVDSVLSKTNTTSNNVVFYTGLSGKREIDFTLFLHAAQIKGEIKFKYFHDYSPNAKSKSFAKYKRFKKSEFFYLNLIEKHGIYKIKIYLNREFNIHLYKGTELLIQTNSFRDINKYLNVK